MGKKKNKHKNKNNSSSKGGGGGAAGGMGMDIDSTMKKADKHISNNHGGHNKNKSLVKKSQANRKKAQAAAMQKVSKKHAKQMKAQSNQPKAMIPEDNMVRHWQSILPKDSSSNSSSLNSNKGMNPGGTNGALNGMPNLSNPLDVSTGHDGDVVDFFFDSSSAKFFSIGKDRKLIQWEMIPNPVQNTSGGLFGSGSMLASMHANPLNPTSSNPIQSTSGDNKKPITFLKNDLAVTKLLELKLPGAIWSGLYMDGVMLCGLGDGTIHARGAADFQWKAHQKRITCMCFHAEAGILCSSDQSGNMKFWKISPVAGHAVGHAAANQMEATQVFETHFHAEVTKFLIIRNKWLYVATHKGLYRVPLGSIETTKPEKCGFTQNTNSSNASTTATTTLSIGITDMFEWIPQNSPDSYLICTLRDGSIKIYDVENAELKHKIDALPNMKMASSVTVLSSNRRCIFGHHDGKVSAFKLPTWERTIGWSVSATNAHVGKVKAVPAGFGSQTLGTRHDIYLLGCTSGSMQLWQHQEEEDEDL